MVFVDFSQLKIPDLFLPISALISVCCYCVLDIQQEIYTQTYTVIKSLSWISSLLEIDKMRNFHGEKNFDSMFSCKIFHYRDQKHDKNP